MLIDSYSCVKVWNTFFKIAREQAVFTKKSQNNEWSDPGHTFSGGTLDDSKMHSLAVVACCLLALQARTSHLIEELREKNKLTPMQARAALHLPIQEQWALLPKLARRHKRTDISFDKAPHQAVAELAQLRNDLFRINYDKLLGNLPPPGKALSLFNEFVYAMEDMNVILGRHKRHHKRVLGIALDKVNINTD